MRCEHVGVAGIDRPLAAQVIDDAGEGRHFAVFVAGAFRVGGHAGRVLTPRFVAVVVPADPRAEHQGQRIDRLDSPAAIQAFLADVIFALCAESTGIEQAFVTDLRAIVINVEDIVGAVIEGSGELVV
ncbi:hypothetical protein D3C80_1619800 [compost metagenome]